MSENATQTTGLTVRLPSDMAEVLRTYSFVAKTSVNDIIKAAVADYLHRNVQTEMVKSAFEHVLEQHEVALDKLKHL